jgi:hypothetical protein
MNLIYYKNRVLTEAENTDKYTNKYEVIEKESSGVRGGDASTFFKPVPKGIRQADYSYQFALKFDEHKKNIKKAIRIHEYSIPEGEVKEEDAKKLALKEKGFYFYSKHSMFKKVVIEKFKPESEASEEEIKMAMSQ